MKLLILHFRSLRVVCSNQESLHEEVRKWREEEPPVLWLEGLLRVAGPKFVPSSEGVHSDKKEGTNGRWQHHSLSLPSPQINKKKTKQNKTKQNKNLQVRDSHNKRGPKEKICSSSVSQVSLPPKTHKHEQNPSPPQHNTHTDTRTHYNLAENATTSIILRWSDAILLLVCNHSSHEFGEDFINIVFGLGTCLEEGAFEFLCKFFTCSGLGKCCE
jgi:hypothetical protein